MSSGVFVWGSPGEQRVFAPGRPASEEFSCLKGEVQSGRFAPVLCDEVPKGMFWKTRYPGFVKCVPLLPGRGFLPGRELAMVGFGAIWEKS